MPIVINRIVRSIRTICHHGRLEIGSFQNGNIHVLPCEPVLLFQPGRVLRRLDDKNEERALPARIENEARRNRKNNCEATGEERERNVRIT